MHEEQTVEKVSAIRLASAGEQPEVNDRKNVDNLNQSVNPSNVMSSKKDVVRYSDHETNKEKKGSRENLVDPALTPAMIHAVPDQEILAEGDTLGEKSPDILNLYLF